MIFKIYFSGSFALIAITLSNFSVAAQGIDCRAFDGVTNFPQSAVFDEKVYIAVPQAKSKNVRQKDGAVDDTKSQLSDEYVKFFVKKEDWPALKIDSHDEVLVKGICNGVALYALVVPLANIKITKLPKRTGLVDTSDLLTHIDDMNFSDENFENFK